jgi:uncharacterized protein YqjF (DUF2071 family)
LEEVPARQLLSETEHRPYPLPSRRWLGRQSWNDLLLAHWAVDLDSLRFRIPPELAIETFDGKAWMSVVPFRMNGVRLRGFPASLGLSFPELNVRTYVRHGGKRGVWFYSLDAASELSVFIGRRLYSLPYNDARVYLEKTHRHLVFDSRRMDGTGSFSAIYERGAPIDYARGSLEEFLTERYCFYSRRADGRLLRCDVHHRRWPLQKATASISRNELGASVAGAPQLLHYSPGVDVLFWGAELLK